MQLRLSVQELTELAAVISKEQKVTVDFRDTSLTVRVPCKGDVPIKPFHVEIGDAKVRINSLGIFECGKFRVWVVKE